ncbi:hypothetical protein NQ176_g381 [Zarea fungicola]|uniref:Uncharacterized protein n=1 Tax=Zarea fungicola TaxID=93591 RepID=A0ACC1NZ67_9HYPO|nr:hypothetical protein NQ176_g381 [Lecanicillium fungicola]
MATKRSWRPDWSQDIPHRVTGLHLAAYFGVQEAVGILLMDWQNVDQKDTWGRAPLSLAVKNGHAAVVELLLATNKVNVDARDNWGGTPLLHAARNGHAAVVELLRT